MDYTDLYLKSLFTTLGQLSAGILSLTLAVPVATYYQKTIKSFFKND
jgi:hypothetical protein